MRAPICVSHEEDVGKVPSVRRKAGEPSTGEAPRACPVVWPSVSISRLPGLNNTAWWLRPETLFVLSS